MRGLKSIIQGLVDLIYPQTCRSCKQKVTSSRNKEFVCAKCLSKIKVNTPPFCYKCGRSLEIQDFLGNICPDCMNKTFYFDRAFSPCPYQGVTKELIHAFKYRSMDYLGGILAKPMADFIRDFNLPIETIDLIIPVPLHIVKLREREFNQALVLANHLSREFNKTVLSDLLIRQKNSQTQTELRDDLRFLNVRGAFSVNNKSLVQDKIILLVDDVLTTGATASEAALTLKSAGAKSVYVLTLAN